MVVKWVNTIACRHQTPNVSFVLISIFFFSNKYFWFFLNWYFVLESTARCTGFRLKYKLNANNEIISVIETDRKQINIITVHYTTLELTVCFKLTYKIITNTHSDIHTHTQVHAQTNTHTSISWMKRKTITNTRSQFR